jgi:ATP-dependent helicase/DNAse subunit B
MLIDICEALQIDSKLDAERTAKLISYLRLLHIDKRNLIDRFERSARLKKVSDTKSLFLLLNDVAGISLNEIDTITKAGDFESTLSAIRAAAVTVFRAASISTMDSTFSARNNAADHKKEATAFSEQIELNMLDQHIEIKAFVELESALQSLENLTAIDPVLTPESTETDISEILSSIQNILNNVEIRPGRETEPGKVHVLRVHRTRGRSYKVAFIVGLNDGFFPKSATDDPFFSPSERTELAKLGLEIDTRQNNIAEERYLFYIAKSRASEELYMSYQSVDSDANKLLKSSFVVDLESELLLNGIDIKATGRSLADIVFDGDAVPIPSHREALRLASSIYRKNRMQAKEISKAIGRAESPKTSELLESTKTLEAADVFGRAETHKPLKTLENAAINVQSPKPTFSDQTIKEYFANRDTFSVSELKEFSSCPFKWFIERTLKPQTLDLELDAINKGIIMHAVLEEFYRELPAKFGVDYPGKDILAQAEEYIEEIFDSVFEREAQDKESTEALFAKHEMLKNLKSFVREEIMRARKRPPGFKPYLLEASFGDKYGAGEDKARVEDYLVLKNGIKMRGKIDRIDADRQGRAIVLDYKSSSISGVKEIENCDDLQVAVYIEAARQLWGLNPVAGGYLSIAKKTSSGIHNSDILDSMYFEGKSGKDDETFDGIIENALEKTCATADELKTGEFAAKPGGKACEYCDLDHICRKDRV